MFAPFRRKHAYTTPWSVPLLLMVVAVLLGAFASGDGTFAVDAGVTSVVQTIDDERPIESAVHIGNLIGYSPLVITIIGMVLAGGAFAREWRDVVYLVFLVVLRAAGSVFKAIFESPRPTNDSASIYGTFDGFGYPSGHVMTATVALAGLGALAVRRVDGQQTRYLIWLAVAGGISLTAFARIWTGAHWFSDTIGAALMGTVIVMISANLAWGRSIIHRRLFRH